MLRCLIKKITSNKKCRSFLEHLNGYPTFTGIKSVIMAQNPASSLVFNLKLITRSVTKKNRVGCYLIIFLQTIKTFI